MQGKVISVHLFFILYLIVIISACNKSESSTTNNTGNSITTTTNNNITTVNDTVVYVAGYTNDGKKPTPGYWRNNILTNLSNTTKGGVAFTLASNGSDLYVGGYCIANNGNPVAVYWKNGVLTKLTDSTGTVITTATISDIQIQGSDVYMCGSVTHGGPSPSTSIFLLKNGVMSNLSTLNGYARSGGIAVHGTDVYITGTIGIPVNTSSAVYWKNGLMITLPISQNYGITSGIAVDNNNIYVAGDISSPNVATCWKNGISTSIGVGYSNANAIMLQGNDVYIAGDSGNNATYWKNGLMTTLDFTSNLSIANGIAVNGNDVYVVGNLNSNAVAMIWKNGKATRLSNSVSANAIAIVLAQY